MEEPSQKQKYFVFSDESGSWHKDKGAEDKDVYVRSWIVVHESGYDKMVEAINYASSEIQCNELRWKTLANQEKYWGLLEKFDFRIFITITCPSDIKWESKYRITRDFHEQVHNLDFGEISENLVDALKKKIFDDIKNVLFLNYYEKTHIENAKKGIDRVLPQSDNVLIYRVDPPQMSKDGWLQMLSSIAPDIQLEFPRSHADEGIQFADIIAGSIRSFLIKDKKAGQAKKFIAKFKTKIITKDKNNPNPNLIFFGEINEEIKSRSGEIWNC